MSEAISENERPQDDGLGYTSPLRETSRHKKTRCWVFVFIVRAVVLAVVLALALVVFCHKALSGNEPAKIDEAFLKRKNP